jgi:hypothetical protein
VQRGLAKASIRALMWEGRHFLSWYTSRGLADDLTGLNIRDIDIYFEMRRRPEAKIAERRGGTAAFVDAVPSWGGPHRRRSGASNYRPYALRL